MTALPSVRTTPEAPALHALLAAMAGAGVSAVVMEVSSHALVLGRVGGIRFAAAGFTNLGRDHLDFHGDLEDYFQAKAMLFDGRAEREVVNVDDEAGRRLADRGRTRRTVSISGPADWRATDVAPGPDGGSTFTLTAPDGRTWPARLRLPGRFNVANAVLAVALLDAAGVPVETALAGVAGTVVPGRMEPVDAGQPFVAVVDYAHTPDAVSTALAALRDATEGRLITVLGCGGDRDPGKRPAMGTAAAEGSDVVVITDDNPRSEDPAVIRAAMLAGVQDVPARAAGRGARGRRPPERTRRRGGAGPAGRHAARRRQGARDRAGGRRHGPPVRRPGRTPRGSRGPGDVGMIGAEPQRGRRADRWHADRSGGRARHRHGRPSTRGPSRRVTCSSRWRGSGSTGTTSSAPRRPPARSPR